MPKKISTNASPSKTKRLLRSETKVKPKLKVQQTLQQTLNQQKLKQIKEKKGK